MGYKIQIKLKECDGNKWHFVKPSQGKDYEYDTFDDADNMIDIIKHENWDRDKYRVFANFTETDKDEKFFEQLNFPDICEGCSHLTEIKDMYSTGDSPTGYECDINYRKDCCAWSDDSWLMK